MNRIPLIIDTDPGVDDFFCIAIGCANPDKFDLRAITTIGGNNYTRVTTQNALNILKLLNTDVPVAPGADRFLTEEFGEPVVSAHGRNGVGEAVLPVSDRAPEPVRAWDMIYKTAVECEGDLHLVTVGPVTNIALAFLKYPDLPSLIKKITCMGGSTLEGNMNAYGEANIAHDALAAKIVFNSGVPIDMIGLNVTLRCNVGRDIFDKMSETTRPEVRKVMQQLIDFRRGEAMHDAVAIATLVDDSWIEWKETRVDVEAHSEKAKVWTMMAATRIPKDERIHRVAWDMKIEGYYAIFERMAKYYTEEQGI